MPERDQQKPQQRSASSGNAKFNENQRSLETVKTRVKDDDSGSDDQEIVAKRNIADIFKNYEASDSDIARIAQFFESGDNVDCLICKKTMISSTHLISSSL